MATRNFTLAAQPNTDAGTRSLVAEVIASFLACGWVQTADTGQADPATVVQAIAANTPAGFVIFRINDTHQADFPVFVKVEIGKANYSSNPGPQFWLSIGRGTDGAGALTGILFDGLMLTPSNSSGVFPTSSNTAFTGTTAGSPASIAFLPWQGQTPTHTISTAYGWFIIERSPTGDSLMICVPGFAGTSGLNALNSTNKGHVPIVHAIAYATATRTTGSVPVAVPSSSAGMTLSQSASLAAGAVGPVYPWLVLAPGMAPWQSQPCLTYPGGDTPGSTFAVVLGGTEYTFLPVQLIGLYAAFGVAQLAGANANANANAGVSRYLGLAVRWQRWPRRRGAPSPILSARPLRSSRPRLPAGARSKAGHSKPRSPCRAFRSPNGCLTSSATTGPAPPVVGGRCPRSRAPGLGRRHAQGAGAQARASGARAGR